MRRLLCRCVAVLHALASLPMAFAVLENINYTAPQNVLDQVAEKLLVKNYAVSPPCQITPPDFDVHDSRDRFYVLQCLNYVKQAQVYLTGSNVFDANAEPVPKEGYILPFPEVNLPTIMVFYSCASDVKGNASKLSSCDRFELSAYRNGDEIAELASIGVTSSRLVTVRPNFASNVFEYNVTLPIGEPFMISAAVKQPTSKVGIEYEGDPGIDTGLPPGMKCRHGSHGSDAWKLPGFKAVGEYRYKLCSYESGSDTIREYHIHVVVTPLYSSKLTSIDVGQYSLDPPFDPVIQAYTVTIPGTVMTIPISATAKDHQASVHISYDLEEKTKEEAPRGTGSSVVRMHDNQHLKQDEAPQWTTPVTVAVKSADGSHSMSYIVTFKQVVSKFCHLKNITIGRTDCVLVPKFDPKVLHYSCEWWWENIKTHEEQKLGEIIPHMETERCKDCQLLAPDNKINPGSYLSMKWDKEKRTHWPDKKPWHREFLYGDHHVIPFQVVSADKFTSSVYEVHLFRNAPWWMQTWFVRAVSRSASFLAIVMAISSATNIMALAKQVQFMTLTTEIDNVPPVYADFANSLKSFNLDAFGWIPWEKLGLPTVEDFANYRKSLVKYLEHQLGIDHATLLLQYCEAIDMKAVTGDMLYPNAILALDPEHTKTLNHQLQVKAGERAATAAAQAKAAQVAAPTTQRRLLDHSLAAIGSLVSRWMDVPSNVYDDLSVNDVKVALRGTGFSVASSSSMVLDPILPGNYSSNHSFRFLDKATSAFPGLAADMHNLTDQTAGASARRLGGLDNAMDELGDDEEEEEEEVDYARKLDWSDEDYDGLLALVMNTTGYSKAKLRGMFKDVHHLATQACQGREVMVVEKTVNFWHDMLQVREMLESTTGVFVILCIGLILAGSIYYAFYVGFMRGNQRRPAWLEPYPLVIFVADYCLISFTKSAAKILFRPQDVELFSWHPTKQSVRIFCACGILFYPIVFVAFIWYKLIDLRNKRRLIWNDKLEAHTDPRCQSLKVTLPPVRIPKFIPIIYQICINHIRAAIPVLDQEGEKLDFSSTRSTASIKQDEKNSYGDADEFQKQIDEEIHKELQNIQASESIQTSFMAQKRKLLQAEKKRIADEKKRKEERRLANTEHLRNEFKKAKNSKSKVMESNTNIDFHPPWFDIVNDKNNKNKGEIPDEGLFRNHSIVEVVQAFKSIKGRKDYERLEQEEKLAMMSWIQDIIRKEETLLRYNIIKVRPDNGYLKPFEPIKDEKTGLYEWKWLPTAADYQADGNDTFNDRGHHKLMDDFMEGDKVDWIEDELNQRLVYKGNDRRYCLGGMIPGGYKGGELEWIPEPEEGWQHWEAEQQKKREAGGNPMVYADKWQWLYFNEDQPWNLDEEEESELNLGFFKMKKADITFYPEVKAKLLRWFQSRVPYRVSEEEKIEMRKWLWKELLTLMEIKLKIGSMADQHEKYDMFGDENVLHKIADMDFHKLWIEVENAEPAKDKLLEHEKKTVKFADSRSELLNFTLMKVEDTYSYNITEPWMTEVDPVGENEYKVMFDTESFWKEKDDPDLKDIRNENDLVPKEGYFSSSEFMNFPDRPFGVKRYSVCKPDGSVSKVKVEVLMRHVLPLMRYTNGFKMNVEVDTLDMPSRDEYNIVLNGAKWGEEFNYIFERLTTLVSIILLAGDPGGQLCAVVFFLVRGSSWVYNLRVSYNSLKYEMQIQETEAREQEREMLMSLEHADEEEGKDPETPKTHEMDLTSGGAGKKIRKRTKFYLFLCACVSAEVTRLFMQTLTLFFLVLGQFGMPPPLCALLCILVCCVTMIMMNFRTATQELKELMGQGKEFWGGIMQQYRTMRNSAQSWLEGDNILGYQFMVFEETTDVTLTAESINLIVPELGITFEGEVEIPEDTPQEEARSMELGKKMVYYSMEKSDDENDKRFKSIREHPRYEGDLSNGFFVALDVEQLMLRKQLPEIVATIHCVNHAGSPNLSRPQYDSYLTLTKELEGGEQWEPEYNDDKEKVNELLTGWNTQFENWLERKLGAVETEKTATLKIKQHLSNLLANECTGSVHRDMFKLKIEKIDLPTKGLFTNSRYPLELDGKLGYVQVVYDFEAIPTSSHRDRRSKFGRFVAQREVNGKGPRVFLDLSSVEDPDFSFTIPVGVTRIKFSIWAQDEAKNSEHLVALSEEQEVNKLAPEGDSGFEYRDEPEEIPLFVTWKLRGAKLQALGVPETGQKEDKKGSEWLKDVLWKIVSCAYCKHVPTEEELAQIRGQMFVKGRAFQEQEGVEDKNSILAIEDLTVTGESSLNHAKLDRHKDRWLTLADVFGVTVSKYDLDYLQDHIGNMKGVAKELDLQESKLSKAMNDISAELTRMKSTVSPAAWAKALGVTTEDNNGTADTADAPAVPSNDKKLNELQEKKKMLEDRERVAQDSARKAKREALLAKGFRRQLEGKGEMDKAIALLQSQIDRRKRQLKEDEGKGIYPLHDTNIEKRIVGKNITQKLHLQKKAEDQTQAEFMQTWFGTHLLENLAVYKKFKVTSSKQILHYIIMSDQLKPSKAWRPDTISPHVCSIVTREFEDVEKVKLTCHSETSGTVEVEFDREGYKASPTLTEGKLCFKSKDKGFVDEAGLIRFDPKGKTPGPTRQHIYLYWDGKARWVFSTKRGQPVPYGLKGEDVRGFMWAQDNAVTPDKISSPWHVWKTKWTQDEFMKVLAPNKAGETALAKKSLMHTYLHDSGYAQEGEKSWFDIGELFAEVKQLFTRAGTQTRDSELKDCLCSLSADAIEFAWKDDQIERLAPFRKFLLQEFGSYNHAWMYMSRHSSFPKELGVQNLSRLFKESFDAFERALNQGEVDSGFARSMSRIDAADAASRPKLARSGTFRTQAKEITSETLGEGGEVTHENTEGSGGRPKFGKKMSSKRTLTRGKSYMSKTATQVSSRSLPSKKPEDKSFALTEDEDETVEEGDLKVLNVYLENNKSFDAMGNPTWESLSYTIMDALDKDRGGTVQISELHDIYEDGADAPQSGPLKEFRDWCLLHPWYSEFPKMWAELSDGVEISIEEFQKSLRHVLLKFLSKKKQKANKTIGVSLVDEENMCTVQSAKWETRLNTSDNKKNVRVMSMSCLVVGDTKAIPLCIKDGTWSIRAEGTSHQFNPETKPHIEPDLDGHVHVTLKYTGIPENKKLYFQFGKGHAAVTGAANFTEVSFYPINPGAPEEKAAQIFADLDTSMSGGISLKELIPISGDRMEHVDRSLLKFSIPLSYIQEIRPEAYRTYGVEKKKSIQIKVNAQFAQTEEWGSLKRALDPDWKPIDVQRETVHFAMRSAYFDLWKQVIEECQMGKPQEWVRFFDGGYLEHQHIKGIFMRNGFGIQRWPDGTVYAGHWENHTYQNIGTLYQRVDDWQKVVKGVQPGEQPPTPIYQGNWHDGVRNGKGTLNWEQESVSTAGDKNPFNITKHIGIRKCYYGQFKNGLFHGYGVLVMRDAVSQQVPQVNQNGDQRLKKILWPNVAPSHLLRFEGEFFSEWNEVDTLVRKLDPSYDKAYSEETEPFLKLQDLRKEDQRKKTTRYLRYFGTDKAEVQKAGANMPDPGLVFYRMRLDGSEYGLKPHQEQGIPAETTQIRSGKATYSDGSEYEGEFSKGWPDGNGKLTVFDFEESAGPGQPGKALATYEGDWQMGEREGFGTYKITDQLTYVGDWKDNRKNGKGRQTIDDACWEEFGYKVYEGPWENDMRTGDGMLELPGPEGEGSGKYVFEGQFRNNHREGHGVMKFVEGEGDAKVELVLYSGAWKNDKVHSPVEDPSWSHMISPDKNILRYYYGGLNDAGERTGHGILYEEKAMEDPEFKKAFHAGPGENKVFQPSDPNKYKLYEGQWRANLPHGEGNQYFDELKGIYQGQFEKGKRQGRGTWTGRTDPTKDSTWTYSPVPVGEGEDKGPPNWDDDKMHGIAIVEDARHVHENVIYTKGECQMPFTMEGPPMTGFDDTKVIGAVVKKVKKTLASSHKSAGTVYAQATLLSKGMKRHSMQQYEDGGADFALGAVLVRQPTDLNTPEEDVLIEGGTGVNEVLNGLYFKMAGTFGLPIYKLVKRGGGLFAGISERYLYQSQERNFWFIGEKYGQPIGLKSVGCACADSSALSPAQISPSVKWAVWHDDTKRVRMPNDPTDPLELTKGWGRPMTPIDEIRVQSIVGFEITGATPDFASSFASSLLLRNPREFYQRPVYEAENGGQYLYWLPGSFNASSTDEGDTRELHEKRLAEGLDSSGIEAPAEVGQGTDIYNKSGAWVIAEDVGCLPGSQKCVAWVVDSGATPHQIDDGHKWVVRDYMAKTKSPFRVNAAFKLKIEEWSRNPAKSLGLLDGEEETTPLLALTDGK